eukprot:CAMPEP_0172707814 /NCGR_PEP_ID=MMETSP1074-20121228/50196_1 /TAXON_ID=2916 /ORGANISM="Ceratium fusus, Strain PA161109" /LENGTH=40 /DNA_ID= /DNA_START= /DNA_END= /DNA_ORIENTATION=
MWPTETKVTEVAKRAARAKGRKKLCERNAIALQVALETAD